MELLNVSQAEFDQLAQRDPELARSFVQQVLALRLGVDQGGQGETGPPAWVDPWGPAQTLADAFLELAPTEYVVAGMLPRPSVAMIFGAPGCLKSMLLMDLALCAAEGRPWLEPSTAAGPPAMPVQAVTTFWLDLDQGQQLTAERLAAFARGHQVRRDCPRLFWKSLPPGGFDLQNKAHLGELSLRMKGLAVQLLCIDNLGIAKGLADENSDAMVAVMAGLRWLAEECGAAVVVLHHARKETGFKSRRGDTVRGHGSIAAGLDLALAIEREEQSPQINVRIAKIRRHPIQPFSALLRMEHKQNSFDLHLARFYGEYLETSGSSLEQLKAAERRESRSTIDDAILECLDGKSLNQAQVIEAVRALIPEAGINQVRKRLSRLERYRQVESRRGDHNQLIYSLGSAASQDDDDDE